MAHALAQRGFYNFRWGRRLVRAVHFVFERLIGMTPITTPDAQPTCRRALRTANVLLLVLLMASFPLSLVLPQSISWENNLLEMLQNLTLLAGAAVSIHYGRKLSPQPVRWVMWMGLVFWLGFLGRELSWGSVLMYEPKEMTQWGPSWVGMYTPFRMYLKGLVVVGAALGVYWFFRYRIWTEVVVRLTRERAWPLVSMALFVFTMLTTINAEGHGFIYLQGYYGTQVMVLEEAVETIGYLALLLCQLSLVCTGLRWRAKDGAQG